MKKVLFLIIMVLCGQCVFSQSLEVYPTSQRYLFNPYNRNNVYIDSLQHLYDILDDDAWDCFIAGDFYPCNEYQMYSASILSPVQVYGVAIPLQFDYLPFPQGQKLVWGYYWENDNLGPRDDSIRNLYWRIFVDSIHVLWSYVNLVDLVVSGNRLVSEMYVYLVQKTDDTQRPIIITDSVKIEYGVNATGWNRFQKPKLYNCTPQNIYHSGGYIVPTLEVYFDHPYTLNDTFFVGNTAFMERYGAYTDIQYQKIPEVHTLYMRDPSGCGYSGVFRSNNGEFIPRQTCEYVATDPRWWRPARYPGSINNSYAGNIWGGPMAIVAPPPCMVANDVRMTQVGYDSATVEWNIPVGVSHCLLEYGPQGFAPGTGTVVDSLTEGRYCIHGLEENTAYEVRVVCWCIYEEGYSDKVSVSFRTAFGCPPVPAVVNCAVTDTTIALTWWMPDSADYTDVEYGPLGFAEGEGTLRPHITRNYYGYGGLMIGGLEPRTAYEIRTRNYCSNSDAMSEWFSFDTVTTGPDTTTEMVNTVLQEQVVLRPNPATTRVTVSSPATITRIAVVDLQGREVCDKSVMSSTAELSTAGWPRGTFIVNIHTTQGTAVKKLTIK